MPDSALEAMLDVQTFPEITGALAITRQAEQGDVLWLFVTLQEGIVLDDTLTGRLIETLRDGVQGIPERVFQLTSFPRTRNGNLMERALSRFINQHELPNRAMMLNPEILVEIARVTGLASQEETITDAGVQDMREQQGQVDQR
jgi:acetoacetyl-CoA synthetase